MPTLFFVLGLTIYKSHNEKISIDKEKHRVFE